jgi:hypothetical protein
MPLQRWVRVYVVRRWCDRFALYFEWSGLPGGIGSLVGTLMGVCLWPDQRMTWLAIAQTVLAASWVAIGVWRPMHKRFGFQRNTRWIAPRSSGRT